MKRKPIQHQMDGLIALLLFGVFAVCVLAVLLTGADAYRRLTERDRRAYSQRTCVQYLATRVRQGDLLGDLQVEDFGGTDALVFREDSEYMTRVYCYEGWLMELYASQELEMKPADGERIMELSGLEMALEDGRLTLTVTGPEGGASSLVLSLRSGEGAAA